MIFLVLGQIWLFDGSVIYHMQANLRACVLVCYSVIFLAYKANRLTH